MKHLLCILCAFAAVNVNAQTAKAGKKPDTLIYKNQTRPDTVVLDGSASTGTTFQWMQLSGATFNIVDPTAKSTFAVGTFPKVLDHWLSFRLRVNGSTALAANDTLVVHARDWMHKSVTPCRAGYDTTAKRGGKKFIVQPTTAKQTINGKTVWGWSLKDLSSSDWIGRHGYPGETIQGGDTLLYEGVDSCNGWDMGDVGGSPGCEVYMMATIKPVNINSAFFRLGISDTLPVAYVKMIGTNLRPQYAYGWQVDNKNKAFGKYDATNNPNGFKYDNMFGRWVRHFKLDGMYCYNVGTLQIKVDAQPYVFGQDDKYLNRMIWFNDIISNRNTGEAFYLGHTAPNGGQSGNTYGPPPRSDSNRITNSIVINSAYDAYQLANCVSGALLENCIAYNFGTANVGGQRAGAYIGGFSTGTMRNNVFGRGTGDAIEFFGKDSNYAIQNIIDSVYSGTTVLTSGSAGIYAQYIKMNIEPSGPALAVVARGNVFSRIEKTWDIHFDINGTTNVLRPGIAADNFFYHPSATNPSSLINDEPATSLKQGNTIAAGNFNFSIDTVIIQNNNAVPYIIKLRQGGATYNATSTQAAHAWLYTRATGIELLPSVVTYPDQARFIYLRGQRILPKLSSKQTQ